MSKKNKRFRNAKAERFLLSLPQTSLDDQGDQLTARCKFNFHYLSTTPPAATINGNGDSLLNHLKVYSEHPLSYWEKLRYQGARDSCYLVYYDTFPLPNKTLFSYPKHVPADVRWARFILTGEQRLIGFVVPENKNRTIHQGTQFQFDSNTFYCVFIDLRHEFWKMSTD